METVHEYVETSGDVFSKPTALSEIIEIEGNKKVVVFCNSPSDADLVEVLLRKKGFKAKKLIGHVPPQKLARAMKEVESGEIRVLVVTDIAGQGLTIGDFDISVNYSIHSDPEIYLQRSGQLGGETKSPNKVISLVGPLDITHFHYLRKVSGVEFIKRELPSDEELSTARLEALISEAKEKAPHASEKIRSLAQKILQREDALEIITHLLVNTYEVIPTLTAQIIQNLDGKVGTSRSQRGKSHEERRAVTGRSSAGRRRASEDDERRAADSDNGISKGERYREGGPRKREARIYIGQGQNAGLTFERFLSVVKERCELKDDVIKRFSSRPNYSFVDVPEEIGDVLVEKLDGFTLENGRSLFVTKAITLTALKEEDSNESEPEELLESTEETEGSDESLADEGDPSEDNSGIASQ